MRLFRSFPRSSPPRSLTRRRAACSARRWPRSALASSATPAIGERLGRNARFASIGNGFAAALMGACGYFFCRPLGVHRHRHPAASRRCWRFATSRRARSIRERAHGGPSRARPDRAGAVPRISCGNDRCCSSACCVGLFHLANAAMLPLMGSVLTSRLARLGHGADRRLHRGAAARRRADRAMGRPAGRRSGAGARCCCWDSQRC